METIRLLVQNLIIIVVLAVLLEMLLPNGEMRRYTKMVMGLMVIVAVFQAAHGLTGGGLFREIEEYAWRSGGEGSPVDILEQGRRIEADNRTKALEQYRKGLERQISSLVALDGKVSLAGAEVKIQDDPARKDFGRVQEINLILDQGEGVKTVESVSVMVEKEKQLEKTAGEPPREYAEAARKAARTVANFYNLPQEQIKVKFRD